MSKQAEVRSFVKMIKTSPQKLNLVTRTIRNQPVSVALNTLAFSKKRVAEIVRKALLSAIANAENNNKLDAEKLIVSEAYVGKAMVLKRMRVRGRGRIFKILKPFSNLTVIVAEKEATAPAKEAKAAAGKAEKKTDKKEGK